MLAIAAWIAKRGTYPYLRTNQAGVERAKREGRHSGRPRKVWHRDLAAKLRAEGWSWRSISSELGVPVKPIRVALTKCGESPSVEGTIPDGIGTS
jgi:lambda repressor-like predicted transcriptional regulator